MRIGMIAGRDTYRQESEGFFGVLGQKLDSHRVAMRRMNVFLSSEFNVFGYIGSDERMLSRIVADLLDPTADHGQGSRFLAAFVAQLGERLEEVPQEGALPLRVEREAATRYLDWGTRFLDVVVRFEDYALAIENKKWAHDQPHQVPDYLIELEREYGSRYCLVYLTPDGRDTRTVPREGVEARGRYVRASYQRDIRDWLDACIQLCESDKYRWFLRDFRAYVATEFPATPASGGVE